MELAILYFKILCGFPLNRTRGFITILLTDLLVSTVLELNQKIVDCGVLASAELSVCPYNIEEISLFVTVQTNINFTCVQKHMSKCRELYDFIE